MERDPITGILGLIHKDKNAPPMVVFEGVIRSVAPWRITVSGLDLEARDIKLNAMLQERCESLNHCYDNRLKVGDTVLMLASSNMQQFYVVCKLTGGG